MYDANQFAALKLEADIAADVGPHPNITRMHAYGHIFDNTPGQSAQFQGLPALLMRFSAIGSLQRLIPTQPGVFCPMEAVTAHRAVRDIAEGVAAVHAKTCLVVEDVKPANVLVFEDPLTKSLSFSLIDLASCQALGNDGLVHAGRVGGTFS